MKFIIVSLFLFSSLSQAGVSMGKVNQSLTPQKTTSLCQVKHKMTKKNKQVKTHLFIKI